jgi:hypothetical protein
VTGFTRSMSADPWHVDRLDLAGRDGRVGVSIDRLPKTRLLGRIANRTGY